MPVELPRSRDRARRSTVALAPVMEGARFDKVEARRGDLRWPLPKDFVARLEGPTVTGLGRRAKYLLADLSSGEVLMMHLGMSGSFRVAQAGAAKHARPLLSRRSKRPRARPCGVPHVVGRDRIAFNDPRRFGSMKLVAARRSSTTSRCCARSGRSRSATHSTPPCWRAPAAARRRASRPRCWTRRSWPASATSMSARRCTARTSLA